MAALEEPHEAKSGSVSEASGLISALKHVPTSHGLDSRAVIRGW